ncbi:MAG: DUF3553 domain-containing protein [Rhodospirillales bacterium]|nr:DUF3553 domain-containing protein [Rhodospirillales bacterium]
MARGGCACWRANWCCLWPSQWLPRPLRRRIWRVLWRLALERSDYEPGQYVRHPGRPDWGLGQVQSATGKRVTVNFENAGKVLVDTSVVILENVQPE